MATNNYYGFTHGGTQNQYQATASQGYTTQYGPAQPGTQPPPTQSYAPASTDQYVLSGYARPAGQVGGQAQQPYYGQGQAYTTPSVGATSTAGGAKGAGSGNPTAPRPATTSTVYPTYSGNTAGNAATSYAGFAQPATANTSPATKSFSNYDAAVYNAVTAYAQGNTGVSRGGNQGLGYNKRSGGLGKMKGSRAAPKPQTLHYCDVCKISCAGPQTYKEHLEGQKHKKKEAAAKVGTPVVSKGSPYPGLRCELCDVTCTGNDAYAAHIRGAKHQKVLKLHTKLGKPIPSDNPTVVTPGAGGTTTTTNSGSSALKQVPITPVSTAATNNTTTSNNSTDFAKPVTPKINFIGPKADFDRYGTPANATTANSTTTGATSLANNNNATGTENSSSQQQSTPDFRTPIPGKTNRLGSNTNNSTPVTPINVNTAQQSESRKDSAAAAATSAAYAEKDIQPVGQDYIDEVRSDDGKLISFNCKLCECRFNDPNAKEMHMKGRRHRLQYKKKVNPDLIVDVKPSSRQKKNEDRRSNRPGGAGRRGPAIDQFPRPPPPLIGGPGGPRGFGPPSYPGPTPLFYIPPLIRRSETVEDLYVMAKHADIYPKEEELHAIQKIVSNTEKALKFVSDHFAENEAKKVNGVKQEEGHETARNEAELQAHRILKGVMRVGHLAKGLLLKGDRIVDLVVLCSEKPTIAMLNQVADTLPAHLQTVASEDTYEVSKDAANSSVIVASTEEPKIQVTVTLTSPLFRGPSTGDATTATAVQVKDDPDQDLNKEKCLAALAALRHAKWFQARATSLQSCVIIIRILRDICQRVPEWTSFPCWAIELLTEKAINSVGMPVSPGDAFRIVLEAVASGILLPRGNGLLDPCEKESVDAIISMNDQDRVNVTSYGQKALRLISFKKINEVLGMEVLPRFNKKANLLGNTRKRRRNNSTSNDHEENEPAGDGKKDKKEDDNMEVENSVVQAAVAPAVVIKAESTA